MPNQSVWWNDEILTWLKKEAGTVPLNKVINTAFKHLKEADPNYIQQIKRDYNLEKIQTQA